MQRELNYNHLFYFWRVATLGSVSRASVELGLAQSTVSAQLKALESELGERLYERRARSLVLTQAGTIVFRHCTQMFEVGTEMCQVLDGRVAGKPQRLRIGVADTIPKVLVYKLLSPLLGAVEVPQLFISAGNAENLLAELSIHTVDAVISDCPIPPSLNVRAYNHLLVESGISFLLKSNLVGRRTQSLVSRLQSTPLLLPSQASAVRTQLDSWFARQGISPQLASEFQDSALMKLFGMHGHGVFPIPTLVEQEVCREYSCAVVGRIEEPLEKIYLITTERRVRNPILSKIGRIEPAKRQRR